MAKVKIQGNASGSAVYTVQTSAGSVDKTITLPDATGTLLMTDGDGSSLTGTGSPSITDNGNATAITIDSSENVGIGTTPFASSEGKKLHIGTSSLQHIGTNNVELGSNYYYNNDYLRCSSGTATSYTQVNGRHTFRRAVTGAADSSISWTTDFQITTDGRGLSQFTAKAWVNFSGTGSPISIRANHNVSTIGDNGTGQYTVNFTNALGSADYAGSGATASDTKVIVLGANSTSSVGLDVRQTTNGTHADTSRISLIVFGD